MKMLKLLKLFKCMDTQVESPKSLKPRYESTLDYINKQSRGILLYLIRDLIGYDEEISKQKKMENIDDFRCYLTDNLDHGIIPIYFQQTSYLIDEKNLKNIIYNELHIDNIIMLIQLLNPEESESSN